MTSPFASLSKIRRMPFPTGQSSTPLPKNIQNEDESAMMDEILGPGARIPVPTNLPSCSNGTTARSALLGEAPTDMELMTSMMQKIAALEQTVKRQAHAIEQKNLKIGDLEDLIKRHEKGKGKSSDPGQMEDLEAQCLQLQRQVWEMELFLNDYGLIWVGEESDSKTSLETLKKEGNQIPTTFWKPGDSISAEPPIKFDVIFENLKDLNVLAGDGTSQVEYTPEGARLKQLDPVPITFYQNGIVMFNGPFRPYEESSTKRCLQDIMDGFFPSELQRRFPAGVPFQVTDKRDVVFQPRKMQGFSGTGQALGRSKLSRRAETSDISGPKLSMEQFLNKLPKSVIRDGQVIDIRESITKTIQGKDGKSHEVIVLETPSLVAVRDRLEGNKKNALPNHNTTILRIKSEDGEKTYMVKMMCSETIGDLRHHLSQNRSEDVEPYEILSSFPFQVYDDNAMTLEECGLVPNACLLLRKQLIPTKPAGE